MALNVWNKPSGYSFGIIQERTAVDIPLPVDPLITNVTYTVISGKLPPGLQLNITNIIGNPYEVASDTIFKFCIRASKTINNLLTISDRTFSITITGADAPIILTPAGLLRLGEHNQYFVMDNTFVDYQIHAIDTDIAAGQRLSYFISSKHGSLPPGLTLSPEGRIFGYVQAVTILTEADGTGTFDNGRYDKGSYDFGVLQPRNGYDYYKYDYVIYDYQALPNQPRAINRNYEFTVTVTDGSGLYDQKTFQIFVVTDNRFRVSSDSLLSSVGLFTADVMHLRRPTWITPADLGMHRANNYITVMIDVYDTGLIYYSIDDVNKLPPGMSFDQVTGEIYGKVPFQPTVSEVYNFTITASRHSEDQESSISTSRTFTITIIGEVNSIIQWNSTPFLGHINANYYSTLKISAINLIPNIEIIYKVTSGLLPPGLTLASNGEIIGKINQFITIISIDNNLTTFDNDRTTFKKSDTLLGLTTFDYSRLTETSFDNSKTTLDRTFEFEVTAIDQFIYSSITQAFTILVLTPNRLQYSNISVRPLLTPDQRDIWSSFITNPNIFTPSSIYRPADPQYGIKSDLSMLIYAGIETLTESDYALIVNNNHKRKRFVFSTVNNAIAMPITTTTPLYEVVYITMIDPIYSKFDNLTTTINGSTYYPNSVTNWQKRISEIGETKPNYLPLWMQTIQPGSRRELGFILAIPLCYCKVGTSSDILLNIKHSNFDFKLIDYTVDRYIVDSVTGDNTDKYIIFNNNRETI